MKYPFLISSLALAPTPPFPKQNFHGEHWLAGIKSLAFRISPYDNMLYQLTRGIWLLIFFFSFFPDKVPQSLASDPLLPCLDLVNASRDKSD